MKRIKAYCGVSFVASTYEEEFEVADDASSEEITEAVDEWAKQFVEAWWEEAENVE